MKKRLLFASVISIIATLLFVSTAFADGIIIPDPIPCDGESCPPIVHPLEQLVIRYHHVTVTVNNQVATTHVDQVFYNPNDYTIEGMYIFPVPVDATISDFVLWIDGEPVHGEVLDAKTARNTYEEIVREMRDPALLEYIGQGAVQARIYPIPPQGERRIELEYTQVLTVDNDLVRYVYPLNTEKFSSVPIESVSVTVDINTEGLGNMPIRAIYSPSHSISTSKIDQYHYTVSYEENNVLPDIDFSLYYSVGSTEAFHLFSYRDPGDEVDKDGFFMLLLAPKPGDENQVVAKDVIIVLDRSGSMEGEKFQQAQSALRYIMQHLNDNDRFYLLTFSDNIMKFNNELSSASLANDALAWIDSQSAAGSTDINRALLEAMAIADKERPTYLIFLTDGLPTAGVVATEKILNNVEDASPNNVRLFAFGVGYDVDTYLLDTLSQNHHGLSTYVKPGEPIDEILSAFYAKISTPVLTNLNLDFGDISTFDIYPDPLPDLFSGSQIVVVGRYKTGGNTDIQLSGELNGKEKTFDFADQEFVKDSRGDIDAMDGLPRLWATRKIGFLLNKIRLQGADQETIDQIVFLSIRYGIVTPYTSYLVTEPMALGAESQKDLAEKSYNDYQSQPTAPASGQAAVENSEREEALSQAEVPQSIPEEAAQQLKTIGSRTFILDNSIWVDTMFDPDKMETQKIDFLSDDYFKLLEARPDIGDVLALGQKVIVVIDGQAYQIVEEGEQSEPVIIPTLKQTPTTIDNGEIIEPDDIETKVVAPINPTKTIQPSITSQNETSGSGQIGAARLLLGTAGLIVLVVGGLVLLRMKKIL